MIDYRFAVDTKVGESREQKIISAERKVSTHSRPQVVFVKTNLQTISSSEASLFDGKLTAKIAGDSVRTDNPLSASVITSRQEVFST